MQQPNQSCLGCSLAGVPSLWVWRRLPRGEQPKGRECWPFTLWSFADIHSSDCKCHLVIRGGYLSEGVDSLFYIDLAWWQLLCSELGAAGTRRDAEVGLAAGLGSRASRNFLDLP